MTSQVSTENPLSKLEVSEEERPAGWGPSS